MCMVIIIIILIIAQKSIEHLLCARVLTRLTKPLVLYSRGLNNKLIYRFVDW